MLDITKDIQSLTTFRRRSGDFIKQLKKSKRPVVLTVKGKAAAIVQDAEAYHPARRTTEAKNVRSCMKLEPVAANPWSDSCESHSGNEKLFVFGTNFYLQRPVWAPLLYLKLGLIFCFTILTDTAVGIFVIYGEEDVNRLVNRKSWRIEGISAVLTVPQKFSAVAGITVGFSQENHYPFYYEFVTRTASGPSPASN